jgi:hypothetical protein
MLKVQNDKNNVYDPSDFDSILGNYWDSFFSLSKRRMGLKVVNFIFIPLNKRLSRKQKYIFVLVLLKASIKNIFNIK